MLQVDSQYCDATDGETRFFPTFLLDAGKDASLAEQVQSVNTSTSPDMGFCKAFECVLCLGLSWRAVVSLSFAVLSILLSLFLHSFVAPFSLCSDIPVHAAFRLHCSRKQVEW